MDVDNIAPGLDFVRVLHERVAECDVVLAVIGKGWIDARDARDRRLDDPDDFVRIEITSALSQGKRVIPVLVGDAQMPRPEELPEALRPLARRNAVRLTHERFRADTQGLVKAIAAKPRRRSRQHRKARSGGCPSRASRGRAQAARANAALHERERELQRATEAQAQERAAAEIRRHEAEAETKKRPY